MPTNMKSSAFRQEYSDSDRNTGERLNIREHHAEEGGHCRKDSTNNTTEQKIAAIISK